MDLKSLQKNWDKFGEMDPLWSILTMPDKKGNKWQIEEFFATGMQEINIMMNFIKSLDRAVQFRRALDFGCGIGRLSQSLAHYFEEVHGIDIAPSMIRLARKYNRYSDKCIYHLNEKDNLSVFSNNSFDFIYSNITLHHMEPKYIKKYLREFVRVLEYKGLLVFHLLGEKPSEKKSEFSIVHPAIKLFAYFKEKIKNLSTKKEQVMLEEPTMEAYGIRQEKVIEFLNILGGKILFSIESNYQSINEVFGKFDEWGYIEQVFSSDPEPEWKGYWYIVTKS